MVMARAAKRPSGPSRTRLRPPEPFRPEPGVPGTGVTLLALRVHRARARRGCAPGFDDPFFWGEITD
ncbi:MAG: hypothetical protein HYR89_11260 [Actinobacteria bacterium]|nr:hypothetical protein [Actinomycetota bacterium]